MGIKKRRIITILILSSLILMTLFIYAKKKTKKADQDQSFIVLLDWYISPDQAPVLLAKNNGYFSKHHLNVELIELSDPSIAPKLIAQEKADLAISYGGNYLHQLHEGLPVKQVGTLIDRPLNCLMYFASSQIHSPQDLKGKRVGYSDPNDDFSLLKAVLKAGNLSIEDVTLVNIQSTLLQSLMSGNVDIATDMLRNIEPVVFAQHGFNTLMFCPEDFHLPDYSELIYITHSGETPKKALSFLDAVSEATEYIHQYPDKAWETLKKAYPKFNTDINDAIWEKTYPLFAKKVDKKENS